VIREGFFLAPDFALIPPWKISPYPPEKYSAGSPPSVSDRSP